MRRPVILVSSCLERAGAEFSDTSCSLSNCYTDAIADTGGLPWILSRNISVIAESVERCDGIVLTGGDDVQPGLYLSNVPTALQKKLGDTDPERDLLELELIAEAFRQNKPLFAICRGLQILNVALGGTLHIDIPTEIPSSLEHGRPHQKDEGVHDVYLRPDSLIHKICKIDSISVNSCHHQSIAELAEPLLVTGISPDGIIEAAELTGDLEGALPFLLGVQFHPERLYARSQPFCRLFQAFIRHCETELSG